MSKSSATDYVESYVNNKDQDNDFLKSFQPKYDPSKPIAQPETTPIEEPANSTKATEASDHYKLHLPTQNPIPSKNTEEQQQPLNAQPEIVWASRDFKEQRGEIHETALTVCADLHENLMTCFQHGSWWDKAKMCEDQKQRFWSCYNTQKKFLKEVNYKGPINTEKEDARILVEAYKLRDKLEASAAEQKA